MMKTEEIFSMSYCETNTGFAAYGLTSSAMDLLVGCIGIDAKTEDEFVANANFYADDFTGNVERAIEDVQEKINDENRFDVASKTNLADLEMLQTMLIWKHDVNELEKLARQDWQEHHPDAEVA